VEDKVLLFFVDVCADISKWARGSHVGSTHADSTRKMGIFFVLVFVVLVAQMEACRFNLHQFIFFFSTYYMPIKEVLNMRWIPEIEPLKFYAYPGDISVRDI